MKNSLMYKMSYYRFHELFGGQPAQDRVRGQTLPQQGPVLDTLGMSPRSPHRRANDLR
jgi:dolichyl-diphosphooligosaccharide--protein glycosyltransferase